MLGGLCFLESKITAVAACIGCWCKVLKNFELYIYRPHIILTMATAKEKSPEAENGNNSLANLLSGLHTASDNVNSPHANGIDFSSVNTKVICCKYLYWNNIGLLTILYCLIITLM